MANGHGEGLAMPKAMRTCGECGKRVGIWWVRDNTLRCSKCTLEDLADAGIISRGEPMLGGWAGYHQRRRDAQQGSAR